MLRRLCACVCAHASVRIQCRRSLERRQRLRPARLLGAVAFPVAWVVVLPLVLLYYPVMESSRRQATLGKRYLRLTVVTTRGKRISVVRALVRFLAKCLSGSLFGIGFVMIAARSDTRGLHDMIAGTQVVWR